MSYNTSTSTTIAANEMLGTIREKAQLALLYFTDVERSIVKATNRDVVIPKQKHVQIILSSTFDRSINLIELFKILNNRLQENSWQIALKTLIVIHYLIREGSYERVMGYLSSHPNIMNMTGFRDNTSGGQGMEQTKNVKMYGAYLEERAVSYRELTADLLREEDAYLKKLKTMKWKDGLEHDVKVIQRIVKSLLEARFYTDSVNNDVTTEALRLLVKDLMRLFSIMNIAVIQILQEFFTLSKTDALSALEVYKVFVLQTEKTVEYFDVARRIQYGLGMTIPELKHAPLSLAKSLQEYLESPDFEQQRTAYIAKGSGGSKVAPATASQTAKTQSQLVDVFSSLSSVSEPQPQPVVVFQPPSNNASFYGTDLFATQQTNQGQQLALHQLPQHGSTSSLGSFDNLSQQQYPQHQRAVQPFQPNISRQESQMSQFSQLSQQGFSNSPQIERHNFVGNNPYMQPQGSYSQPTLPSQASNFSGAFSVQNQAAMQSSASHSFGFDRQASFQQQQQQPLFGGHQAPQLGAIPGSNNTSVASMNYQPQYPTRSQQASFQSSYSVQQQQGQNQAFNPFAPQGTPQQQLFGTQQQAQQRPPQQQFSSLI